MNMISSILTTSFNALVNILRLSSRQLRCGAWASIAGLTGVSITPVQADLQEVNDIYLQSRTELIKLYQSKGDPFAKAYSAWKPAASAPAKPGVHGSRYLMTYVNDIGHATYVKYAPTNVNMPVGSIVAKESFKLRKGVFKPGPLFFMEKVGIDKAPDTDGWFYSGVKPNGKAMKSSQSFCHGCHKGYGGQDFLGYPVPEARLAVADLAVDVTPGSAAHANVDVTQGDISRGKSAAQVCMGCHQVGENAQNGVGPVLNGIFGRPAANYSGYKYSNSLKRAGKKGLVWNEAELFKWLAGPKAFLQGYLGDGEATTNMSIQFSDPQLRKDVVAYLRSLGDR